MTGEQLYAFWAYRCSRFKGSLPLWEQLQFRERVVWNQMAAEAIVKGPF